MNYKYILPLCITVAICTALYLLKTANNTKQKNAIIVGIATGYAPYVTTNAQGDYEGFDIDAAYALGQQLNKTVQLKDLGSMSSLLIALEQGTVDMVMWGLSITNDRLQKIAMVHYQGAPETTNPLLFWQDIPGPITSLDDMKGRTVCIEPASFHSDIISAYPDIILLPVEKIDDALFNIQYGKADAAFIDPVIAQKFQKKYPELQVVDIPLDENKRSLGMGIALRKNSTQLIQEIKQAVQGLKTNGIIKELELKWGLS